MKRGRQSNADDARDALIRNLARDLSDPWRYDLVEDAKNASLFRAIFIRSVREGVPWEWLDRLATKRNTPLKALLKTLIDQYSMIGSEALRIVGELMERKCEIEREHKKAEYHKYDLQRTKKRR